MSNPNPEALLEHVGFLRAIALGMLRNEADAEDVVQQTLVAAMEKPPADDRNLKGWLAAVARNFALMQFRSRKRRREREAKMARAEGGPSAAQIAERMEMERRVVDAVAALDEPFKTTLILRYYDNMTPKQIAAHLGIPDATVRTRLKRGHDKLRRDLEKRSGGRQPMLAGLLLLAQLPAQASPWPARMVALSGVAAVLVGIVAVGWLVRERQPVASKRAEVVRAEGPEVVESERVPAIATISGRVVNQLRVPLRGAEVVAIPHRGPGRLETPERRIAQWLTRPEPIARSETDASGRYALRLPAGAPVWIVARKAMHVIDAFPLLDTSGAYTCADLLLAEGEGVQGRLVDEGGKPVPGIWVHGWDLRFRPDFAPALCVDRTDADGVFHLAHPQHVGRPNVITVVLDGREQQYMPRVVRDRWPRELRIHLVRGAEGSLRTEPGTRVVLVGRDRFTMLRTDDEGLARWNDTSAETMEALLIHPERSIVRVRRARFDGAIYELPAVGIQRGKASLAGAEVGLAPAAWWRDTAGFGYDCIRTVRADDTGEFAIRGEGFPVFAHPQACPVVDLDGGPELFGASVYTGRVTAPDGTPIAGARVQARPRVGSAMHNRLQSRHYDLWSAISRPDGSFEIRHLPHGWEPGFRIEAEQPGLNLSTVSNHRAETLRLERKLSSGFPNVVVPGEQPKSPSDPKLLLQGTVTHNGSPVAGAVIRIEGQPRASTVTGPGGDYRLPVLHHGTYTVLVHHPQLGSGRFPNTSDNAEAILRIPQWEPFHGRVTHKGAAVANAYVRSHLLGRAFEETRTDAHGRFQLMCTPFDREFELVLGHDLFMTAWLKNPAEGDIELERAASVRVRVVDEQGMVRSGVDLVVDGHRRRSDRVGRIDVFQKSESLEVSLPATGQDWVLARPVEWSEDGAVATVHIRRGLRIEGQVRDLQNRPVPHVLVQAEAKGRPTRRTFTNSRGRFVLRTLHPDRYALRVAGQGTAHEFDAGTENVVLRKEKE
ncbi:MAG: sigma-70 family RNA polymerase sigma factor [Planctomycetota bacterium]